MSNQFKIALGRAVLTCLATGALTTLSTYQVTQQWTPALVAGGAALCGIVLARFGVEGTIDTLNADERRTS